MKKLLGLCLILCLYSVPNANALTITVDDNLQDNTLMSPGSLLNGTFDITSKIPANGQYIQPYKITGATATFQFTDNLDKLSLSNPVTSEYVKYETVGDKKYFIRYETQWKINPQEQVQVNIDGQISYDGTKWYEIPLSNTGDPHLDKTTGGGKNFFYTQLQTGEHGYTGTVTLTEALGLDGLTDLSLDGKVPFTLSMLQGDITYLSGTLTADLDANPLPDPAAPVPEPGTMMLLGMGFLGVTIYAKRRKNA